MKHKIDLEKLSVVLIDMQPSFLELLDQNILWEKINNQKRVLNFCSKRNSSLIVLEWKGKGKTIDYLSDKIQGFEKRKFLLKDKQDGFKNPLLADTLNYWNVDTLLLMGVCTSLCVKETGKGALENGFKFMTSYDLVDDLELFKKYSFCNDWVKENSLYYFHNSKTLLNFLRNS